MAASVPGDKGSAGAEDSCKREPLDGEAWTEGEDDGGSDDPFADLADGGEGQDQWQGPEFATVFVKVEPEVIDVDDEDEDEGDEDGEDDEDSQEPPAAAARPPASAAAARPRSGATAARPSPVRPQSGVKAARPRSSAKAARTQGSAKASASVPEVFPCEQCPMTFTEKREMLHHVLVKHEKKWLRNGSYKCELCEAVFCNKSGIRWHLAATMCRPALQCDLCPKQFSRAARLREHRLSHKPKPVETFHCDMCPAEATDKRDLLFHKFMNHTDDQEEDFECELCGAVLSVRSSMKAHLAANKCKPPVQCDLCPKTFHRNGQLAEHRVVHTRKRAESDDPDNDPDADDPDEPEVRVIREVSDLDKPVTCEECGRVSSKRRHHKIHYWLAHGRKKQTEGGE